MANPCIFCDIVAKKAPAELVHEDERAVAFPDAAGVAPVHLLVVPRQHVESIDRTGPEHDELLRHLMAVARDLGRRHDKQGHGYRIVINAGPQAEIPHLHLHVVGGREQLGTIAQGGDSA